MDNALLLILALIIVPLCVLIWCKRYSWFAENREMNDQVSRSATSWNTEHQFFDKITEFRDDFS